MNRRENVLRAIRFERPEYIPMTFHINDACWQRYPQDFLFDMMESHKLLFPDFQRPQGVFKPDFALVARKDAPYTDDWGCTWETTEDGITGTVKGHPLRDWKAFDSYTPPDPRQCTGIGPINWEDAAAEMAETKRKGDAAQGILRHGHTFLQLCDIRGYQNLIFDMADYGMSDNDVKLDKLIKMIEEFNLYIVNKYIEIGADMICYPEDLGMKNGPLLSPAQFRDFIKPSYQRLMQPARKNGIIVHMHSDGYLHELIDDIIDGGVEVMNLQDLVNGVDWIAAKFAGKICVELDIDRQFITSKGTPEDIDALIREEVKKIARKEGGLMMIYGLYPGVPLENVKAVMDAMEKYAY